MAGYGTDEGFTSWLALSGLTLPAGAPAPAILRQVGSDYIDAAYSHLLACSQPTDPFTQERAWPRVGHTYYGQPVPETLIPAAWINASYRAAWLEASQQGFASSGRDPSRLTKREKVEGAVEREFFETGKGASLSAAAPGFSVDPMIDGSLSAWACAGVGEEFAANYLGIWSVGS